MRYVKQIFALLFMAINMIILPQCSLIKKISYQPVLNYANNLITYFHYNKCLAQAIYSLSYLDQSHYDYAPCNCTNQQECIQIDTTLFFHPIIQHCIHKICITKSVTRVQ